MRCVPECSFSQVPDNSPALLTHMYSCDLEGPLRRAVDPVVVWRDGFAVVDGAKKGEAVFDIGFERISHEIELPILDVDLVDGVNVEPVPPVEVIGKIQVTGTSAPK